MKSVFFCIAALSVAFCQATCFTRTPSGGLAFDGGEISIHARIPGWAPAQLGCDWNCKEGERKEVFVCKDAVTCFRGEGTWQMKDACVISGGISLTCAAACEMQCVALAAEFVMGPVIGREWKADGTVRVLPQKIGDSQGFGSGTARRFEFPLPQGRTLVMTFPEPVFYQAQDARLWGSRWSIRLEPLCC